MAILAIRDDDTSFWTKPEELEGVYAPVWREGGVVSLAVVPFSVRYDDSDRYILDATPRPLGDNPELTAFLRDKVRARSVEIMMHGYDHSFKVSRFRSYGYELASKERVDSQSASPHDSPPYRQGEFRWKSLQQATREIKAGKEYLEKLLECEVRVFVPPENDIGTRGVRAVSRAGLDILTTIERNFDRPVDAASVSAYLRARSYRISTGRRYPFPLSYRDHRELTSYTLLSDADFADLKSLFDHCAAINAPCVLATHYWELFHHRGPRDALLRLVEYAHSLGERCAAVSECFSITPPRSVAWRFKRLPTLTGHGID